MTEEGDATRKHAKTKSKQQTQTWEQKGKSLQRVEEEVSRQSHCRSSAYINREQGEVTTRNQKHQDLREKKTKRRTALNDQNIGIQVHF